VVTERQGSVKRVTKSASILIAAQGLQFDHRPPVLLMQDRLGHFLDTEPFSAKVA